SILPSSAAVGTSRMLRGMGKQKRFITKFITAVYFLPLLSFSLYAQTDAGIDVAAQPGNNAAEKLNYAIAISSDNQVLDLSGFKTPQTLDSQVNINKSLTIVGCQTTFTETMPDLGVGPRGGGINISADHVTFDGAGQGKCILRQQDGENIQTLVQSAASGF